MKDQNTPGAIGSSDLLGPSLVRLRLYLLAYASATPMFFGWVLGVVLHRIHDGWKVARRQLDRLDDAVIDDMDKHKRGPNTL